MALLRDNPTDLGDAVQAASARLGGLDPTFIEKDYWVTQVLRVLHVRYPHEFVLKGGTSLSKGYGIIERFSEDVDILTTPTAGATRRSTEQHLADMTTTVAAELNLIATEARPPGRGRNASRGDNLAYPAIVTPAIGVAIRPGVVLLETGYSGGQQPTEIVTITTLVGEALDLDPAEYVDVAPFRLRALEPRRTLIEKLFALHHIATCWTNGDVRDSERFGRHYYDIYKLLDHPDTKRKLANRDDFDALVAEVERLSAMHFGGTTPRPAGGFAVSPAFAPADRELRAWLDGKFADALELLPRASERPRFGHVLQRVEQHAALL